MTRLNPARAGGGVTSSKRKSSRTQIELFERLPISPADMGRIDPEPVADQPLAATQDVSLSEPGKPGRRSKGASSEGRASCRDRTPKAKVERAPRESVAAPIANAPEMYGLPVGLAYLRDKEVGARYNIHRTTVWEWVKTAEGFPKPVQMGNGAARWFVPDLLEYVQKLRGGK